MEAGEWGVPASIANIELLSCFLPFLGLGSFLVVAFVNSRSGVSCYLGEYIMCKTYKCIHVSISGVRYVRYFT